jgi:hypothetical protein
MEQFFCYRNIQSDGADADLRAAITAGVRRVMQSNVDVQKMPADSRIQLESSISSELFNRLMMRLRQLDAAVEGSQAIAKDFMKSALKTIALRLGLDHVCVNKLSHGFTALIGLVSQLRASSTPSMPSKGIIKGKCFNYSARLV